MKKNEINNIEAEIESLKKEDYQVLKQQNGFMVDGILGGFRMSIHKMTYTFIKQVLLGILSGVIIGFGYTACLVAINALPHGSGFASIMIGIFFPGCIILITYLGGGLYTTHVVATIPMMKKTIKVKSYIKGIFGVLLGNYLGTLIFVLIFSLAGGLTMTIGGRSLLIEAYSLGVHKLYSVGEQILQGNFITSSAVLISLLAAFASGILCNFMVSATLPLTNSSKHPVVALLVIIFPILFFAMSGFQHGPANSYFLWIMVIVQIFQDIVFSADVTQLAVDIRGILMWETILLFATVCLIPSLLGNWISGALLLPGILHLTNKKYTEIFFKKARLAFLEKELIQLNNQNDLKKINKQKKQKK